jgi:tetratricopeptide (TPR) repeat protein
LARQDDYVPISVKRALWFQSHGICQYLNCTTRLLEIDPVTGEAKELGQFAHILPAGDGPRRQFRKRYSRIRIDSVANIIYLCGHHHQMVDKTEIDQHPPSVLFGMKVRKNSLISDRIAYANQLFPPLLIDHFLLEYNASGALHELKMSRELGPKFGREKYRLADRTIKSLLKDPFISASPELSALLESHLAISALYVFYRQDKWKQALRTTEKLLRRELKPGMKLQVCSASLELVRDEYNLLAPSERLSLITLMLKSLDLIDCESEQERSGLLILKSHLLRWRGRHQRGRNQKASFEEASRCVALAFSIGEDPLCKLQEVLINYSFGISFSHNEFPAHESYFERALEGIESPELIGIEAAQRYKARLFRETYRFSEGVEAFWHTAATHLAESKRTAYILAEATLGAMLFDKSQNQNDLAAVCAFVRDAIEEGFDHGRNIAAYISCKGIADPAWFKEKLLSQLFAGGRSIEEWPEVLELIRRSIIISDTEPGFGIDDGEFWCSIASTAVEALNDHEMAIELYRVANNHAEITGGKFRARLGLAASYLALGDIGNSNFFLGEAREVARSQHAPFVRALRQRQSSAGA